MATPHPITYKQILANMESLQKLAEQVGEIDLTVLDDAIKALEEQVTEHGSELDIVVETVDSVKSDIDTVKTSVTAMQESVAAQQETVDSLTTTVETVEATVTDVATKVEDLNDKVVNPPTTGDITNTDDGIKVVGVHVNTTNINNNYGIDQYTQGATVEIKSTEVMQLKGQAGMSGDYCFVITYRQDAAIEGESTEFINVRPVQIAYATDGAFWYVRHAEVPTNVWSEWSSLEIPEQRIQFVTSDTEPDDQKENEYWCEPIA